MCLAFGHEDVHVRGRTHARIHAYVLAICNDNATLNEIFLHLHHNLKIAYVMKLPILALNETITFP